MKETLSSIEEELIQVKAKTRQDILNYPAKLNAKLAALSGTVGSADAAPTRQEYELFDALAARVDVQLKRLREVIDTDVAAFNNLIREQGVSGGHRKARDQRLRILIMIAGFVTYGDKTCNHYQYEASASCPTIR